MSSSPEQHIDSLPSLKREEAYRQVAMVCAFRMKGQSEDEVAKNAKFNSVEDMYFRLKRWGLSGLLPEFEEAPKTPKPVRPRKARSSGPVRELPAAGDAAPLLRAQLEGLARATDELKHRKEKLQGKLFVQSSMYTEVVHYFREKFSDEQWKYLSEHYGFNPGAERFSTSDVFTWQLGGGTSVPQAPLPTLIGTYLLAGGDVESLTEALHHDPASADWSKIKKRVEGRKGGDGLDGIKALAEQLAVLIRGGTLGVGSPPGNLSRHEFNFACRITDGREAQVSDEKIYEDLLSGLGLTKDELSWDEFCRLADLELSWPWTKRLRG
jgi:hypothetical protein